MLSPPLIFGVDGAMRLELRQVTGADERMGSEDAQALIGRLAQPAPGAVPPGAVERLTIGDRDRALAALYRDLYGDAVTADATCVGCGRRYELRFSLSALLAGRAPDGSGSGDPARVSVQGAVLRLPTVADLAEGQPEALLHRLRLDGPAPDADAADAALEAADPALELDLSGACAECGETQRTPFSMRGFLTAALVRDLAFLTRETHLIASAYGWRYNDILALTRAERQDFARLLIAEWEAGIAPRRLAS